MNETEKQVLEDFFHDINNFLTTAVNCADMFCANCNSSCNKENIEQQRKLLTTSILSIKKTIEQVKKSSKVLLLDQNNSI
jgi:hypothetical protein